MFKVNDPVMGARYFNTIQEAEIVLAVAQKNLLAKESLRFNINLTEQLGLNITWRVATDVDPENGEYKVFVYNQGIYESFNTLSAAKVRNEALKMEFLTEMLLDQVFEADPPVENTLPTIKP